MVTDPAAVKVCVSWSDGMTETVSILNESSAIVRAGQVDVDRAEALDAVGTVTAAHPP